jgi:pimeloyl-ACP methyl ester carboxylesterase
MTRAICILSGLYLLLTSAGCAPDFGPKAVNGMTFYIPGAGNVDLGEAGVRQGLEAAGYKGQVGSVLWTVAFNAALDQRLGINARLGASALARKIQEYRELYPQGEVTLIGLSAGSGVAIWSLEELPPGVLVDHVILLGSSLWSDYDVSAALRRVKGKIYVFFSPNDAVLSGPMKLAGTIDGKFGPEAVAAGEIGLRVPRGAEGRIVNIGWRRDFADYGYFGGHTDATNARFVQRFLAPIVMGAGDPRPSARPQRAAPKRPE